MLSTQNFVQHPHTSCKIFSDASFFYSPFAIILSFGYRRPVSSSWRRHAGRPRRQSSEAFRIRKNPFLLHNLLFGQTP